MKKTLLLYLYKENDDTKINLDFFVKHGVTESDDITFKFLINDFVCTVPIPQYENISIIKKSNSFDLSSYHVGLEPADIENFDYFIFMNSSCIGPFLPTFIDGPWHQSMLTLLDHEVKLVGPVVEIPPDDLGAKCIKNFNYIQPNDQHIPFIHTYMFATDKIGLAVLKGYGVFIDGEIDQLDLIQKYERLISSAIINEGFKIKSLLLRFKRINLVDKKEWVSKKWSNKITCPEVPNNYDGIDLNPLEIIFVKNLRRKHLFRKARYAGISKTLKLYLHKYIEWQSL